MHNRDTMTVRVCTTWNENITYRLPRWHTTSATYTQQLTATDHVYLCSSFTPSLSSSSHRSHVVYMREGETVRQRTIADKAECHPTNSVKAPKEIANTTPMYRTRLISAAADWMSAILPHMVWPYCEFKTQVWNLLHAARWKHRTQKSRQKSPSGYYRTTLSGDIFAIKARIDNRKKTC